MKRPAAHETDDKGDAIFRSVFAKWAVNPSEKDYGWDYVVEVFRDGVSTGLLFNAQLKSSASTPYSAEGKFISQPLERDAAEYLATQLKQPTFLFHADVERRLLFWSAIQLDNAVLKALDEGQTNSLTVRIPASNLLPDHFDRFLEDIQRAHCVVVGRALMSTTDTDFVAAVRGQPLARMDDVAGDLHEKAFRLEMQKAHELHRDGNTGEAIQLLKRILASTMASLHVQFNATLQVSQLESIELMRSDKPQILAAEQTLLRARQLCRITKKGPKHLRLAALITRTSAELGVIVRKHLGLTMIWRAHLLRGEDALWSTVLTSRLYRSLLAADRKYRQALRLARATAGSPYRWVAPRPMMETALQIVVLAGVLENSDFPGAAQQYRDSAFRLFKFAAAIATENKNMDELSEAVMGVLIVDASEDGEALAWSRSIVAAWDPEGEHRLGAERFTSRILQRRKGVKFENDIDTNSRQIHQNILSAFGIDAASQPWAGLIDLAIKDADPGRVLKGCEHTFVCAGPWVDPTLKRLGLEYAGRKTMHCTLHKYAVSGPDFDSVNGAFEQKWCSSCGDKSPRSPDWKYSDEWQQNENERWTQYLAEFFGK